MTLSPLAQDCILDTGGPLQSGAGPAVDKEREIELAKGLLSGDADAFERFVEHFRIRLFQYTWL
ncbi:MAG: hypothetical protein ABSH47_26160, partial [Bryobacteraceae bacterium]